LNIAAFVFAAAVVPSSFAAITISPSTCETLVDDMRARTPDLFRLSKYGDTKTLNLLGGDYGVDGSGSTLNGPTDGKLNVIPGMNLSGINPPNDPGAWVHPADQAAANYFFFKFEWDDDFNMCMNLQPYAGLVLTVTMPKGSDVSMTLTGKFSNCTTRSKDSQYVKLSTYLGAGGATGSPQSLYIPFKDLSQDFDGLAAYDFVHNKDITFVNFSPAGDGTVYTFNNIRLYSNANNCAITGDEITKGTTGSVQTVGTGGSGSSPTTVSKTAGAKGLSAVLGFVAVIAGVLLF